MGTRLTISRIVFLVVASAVAFSIAAGWLWLIVHFSRVLAAIGSAPVPVGKELAVAAAELRAAERVLEALQVILAVSAVFSVAFPILLAIVTAIYAREWVDERIEHHTGAAVERIRQQTESTIGNAQKRASAILYNHLAVLEWRRLHNEQKLDFALSLARGALQLAEQLPTEELGIRATVKSNIAYYTAESGISERRDEALRFAATTRAFYDDHAEPDWEFLLANSLYVRMRYARDCDAATLQPLADEMKEISSYHPGIRDEVQRYLQELMHKCPAVR